MSETTGERPEESVPQPTPETPAAPESSAPQVPAVPAAAAAAAHAPQGAPATPPVAPTAQTAPTTPQPAWGTPPAQGYPRPPYTGTPHPGYAAPQRQAYAGQPASGVPSQPIGPSFGLPTGTQPTLALPDAADESPRKKSNAGKIVGLIVAAALVGGAAGLGGAYAGYGLWGANTSSPAAGPETITVNNTQDVNATTAIAAKVVPSVVTISASSTSASGTGSGVILSEDGYVVTNTHVVTLDGASGSATITATTSDGRVFKAEVVGTDPTYDLAVIKLVDASGLTPIEFADSSQLNVGDATVAIGAPLGLSNTVTTGIVSALNRSIAVASSAAPDDGTNDQDPQQNNPDGPFYFDFGQGQQGTQATQSISISVIQTDAAINPGNSGGALVDDEGKLIGINVAIATAGGSSSGSQAGSIGVGFSIPSDIAQRVASEIIDNGAATHGLLGASVASASTAAADAGISGAYISNVTAGGAAEAAGLGAGDIVTKFNGLPVTNSTDLTALVRSLAGGSKATLTYVRDGQSHTVDVTLGTLG